MTRMTKVLHFIAFALLLSMRAHAGTVTYVYTDPQGTPLAEADAQGNITARFDYTPYGSSISSLGSPPNGPGYTGHVNDPDTGLVYMQARYYDPEVGRFLSVDIVGPRAGDVFSTNMYVYVRASPAVLLDPAGKEAKKGKDMDICNGPVRCDANYVGSGTLPGESVKVERVFNSYIYTGGHAVASDEMPEELKVALTYILGSPLGRPLISEALRTGQKIGLMEIPSNQRSDFRYDAGSGLVLYTLNLANYKAQMMNTPLFDEVKDQTLDVILMHEIGHTPLGRSAFGITTVPATQLDEFEDIKKVENPYRSFYGIPARASYSGVELP